MQISTLRWWGFTPLNCPQPVWGRNLSLSLPHQIKIKFSRISTDWEMGIHGRRASCSVPVPNICIRESVCKNNCSALQFLYFWKGHGIREVFAYLGWLQRQLRLQPVRGKVSGRVFVVRSLDLGCWGVAELRGQEGVAGPLVAVRCEEGGWLMRKWRGR